jgi:hypothetical protein
MGGGMPLPISVGAYSDSWPLGGFEPKSEDSVASKWEARVAGTVGAEPGCCCMGNHFELWDKATYDAQEAKAMQGDMPDVFKDFSF